MTSDLKISTDGAVLVAGAELDATSWERRRSLKTGEEASALQVFQHLSQACALRHLVVGVIGPREASRPQLAGAEQIGRLLGSVGVTVICGGRAGVMEAVSKGCATSGGLAIGLLPGDTPDEANPFISVALPTGLGEARNMIIAKSARVLIAVGGSYGTLTEVAYGLHFSKPVIGIEAAPQVEGVEHASCPADAVEQALAALLAAAPLACEPNDL